MARRAKTNDDKLMTAVLQMDFTTRAAFIKTCQVIQGALAPAPTPRAAKAADVFGAPAPVAKKRGRPRKNATPAEAVA